MDPFVQALLRPEAYEHAVAEFEVLETHISWVILTGDFAYKLKKPVDLGFVDFTTLERRRHFCDVEVRLNRRLADDLYLGVKPIFGSPKTPSFVGSGEPIEYAVQMRQFPQSAMLPEVLRRNEVHPEHIDQVAMTVAQFHREADSTSADSDFGSPEAVKRVADENFDPVKDATDAPSLVEDLRAWSDREFVRLLPWFMERKKSGRVRDCHGDMHLGNMVLIDDQIRVFDCLEFNDELRWTDVIAEVSFLVMDLQERGRPDLATRFLNRWLEQSGDYEGLNGWRWYFIYRAMVRAKVAAIRLNQAGLDANEQDETRKNLSQYLQLAHATSRRPQGSILLMHGVSGSGKSYVADWAAQRFQAIRLRSDAERKRLFGQWGDSIQPPLTGDIYAPDITDRVYRDILPGHTATILNAGSPVIVDATFLRRWQREIYWDLASKIGAALMILDITAPEEVLKQRLASRRAAGQDPSDADATILEKQLNDQEPLTDRERQHAVPVRTDAEDWRDDLAEALPRLWSAN